MYRPVRNKSYHFCRYAFNAKITLVGGRRIRIIDAIEVLPAVAATVISLVRLPLSGLGISIDLGVTMSEPTSSLTNDERQEFAKSDQAAHTSASGGKSHPAVERPFGEQLGTNADDQHVSWSDLLDDAEHLLAYSVQEGIELEPGVRSTILKTREASKWDQNTVDQMLGALTTLAHKLKPVTPQSLRDCARYEKKAKRTYQTVAIVLAIFIVPYSVATFITSALSDAVRKDIVIGNALAVRLTETLKITTGPVPESNATEAKFPSAATLTDLQQFAATARAIDNRARILRAFLFNVPNDPFYGMRDNPGDWKAAFEVPLPLPADLAKMGGGLITNYQTARYFGATVDESVSVFYGAMAACILPPLYALLGTCAFLLRNFEKQVKARTFIYNEAHGARFVVAAIGGGVVGLFSSFAPVQTASISPLAIAFIVGYAVDVFFSFLEGILPKSESGKTAGTDKQRVAPEGAARRG